MRIVVAVGRSSVVAQFGAARIVDDNASGISSALVDGGVTPWAADRALTSSRNVSAHDAEGTASGFSGDGVTALVADILDPVAGFSGVSRCAIGLSCEGLAVGDAARRVTEPRAAVAFGSANGL